MQTPFRSVTALAVSAVLVTTAGCGGDDPPPTTAEGLTAVTVTLIPIIDVAPTFVGIEQGFFKEEGIDLSTQFAEGGAAIVPAVVSDDVAFGFSNNVSLIVAATNQVPVTAVIPGVDGAETLDGDFCQVITRPDSGIEGPADLAGRTISVNTVRNIVELTIRAALANQGVATDAIEFTEVPFPEAAAVVGTGDVDAASTCEPFLTTAIDDGLRPVLSNVVGVKPGLPVASYFTSDAFAAANPDLVDSFARAMRRSLEYATANPDQARAAILRYTNLDPAIADRMRLPMWRAEFDRPGLQLLAELAEEYEFIDVVPDRPEAGNG